MAKKFVEIKFDKTRNLRFGMVALMKIEKKLGKPFSKIDFEGKEKMLCPHCKNEVTTGNSGATYEEIATVIWGGLVHEDSSLTPEKVAELIDEYSDIATAMEAMGEAMQEAFTDGKNAQGAANKENGTGTQPSGTPSDVG